MCLIQFNCLSTLQSVLTIFLSKWITSATFATGFKVSGTCILACFVTAGGWKEDGENQIGALTDGSKKSGPGHCESLQAHGQSTLTPTASHSNKQVQHVKGSWRYKEKWRYQGKPQWGTKYWSKRQRQRREDYYRARSYREETIKICRKLSFVSSTAHKSILFLSQFHWIKWKLLPVGKKKKVRGGFKL